MATPDLKVFDPAGEYVASCKRYEDAACLAGMYGEGAEIRFGHSKKETIWREGFEEFSAADSYDRAARVMSARRYSMKRAALVRAWGEEKVIQWEAERVAR